MLESSGYWKQLYRKLEKEFNEVQDQLTRVTVKYSKLIEKNRKQKQKLVQLSEQNKALKASQKVYEENSGLLMSTICGASPTIQQSLFRSSFIKRSPSTCKRSIQRMFEGLFILGDSKEGPGEVKVLEQYPGNCEPAHSVIGNFAFPQGLRPFIIDFSQSGTALFQLLYPKYSRDENSFVFTMKSEALGTLGYLSVTNNDKEVIYGCCVIKHELIGNEADQMNVPAYPKCYCLLSYFPCFELHFQVLYSLLSIGKAQSLHDEGVIELLSRDSIRSGSSNLGGEDSLLLEEQKGLLDAYYSENFLNSRSVSINLQTVPSLKVNLPQDLSLLDIE